MMELIPKFENMDCKSLDDHCGDAEEMDQVLSTGTADHTMIDDIDDEADIPLRTTIGLDAPSRSCSIEMDRQVARQGLGASDCPPSKRNGNFADPMAWLLKPSSRMAVVYRDVRRPLPWFTKGLSTSRKTTTRVVHPPPVLPNARTGVSQAALKYKATDRIKKLAEHRSVPKMYSFDERLCFSVKPHTLTYSPSLRIRQLAMPRNHSEVKDSHNRCLCWRSNIKCNGILHFEIAHSIAPVLGFEKREYKPEYEIRRSEKAVNLNTINSIKVMCNIAQSHSIYEFFPSKTSGSKLVEFKSIKAECLKVIFWI
eukprot:XP_016659730.1 PREDICTED: uncharacterized protein LOC100569661 [Acyrthosiphon pisum]